MWPQSCTSKSLVGITYKIVRMKKAASTNSQNEARLRVICPMTHALAKIGNRWKPLILFKLLAGDLRFGELRHNITAITDRMLTLSLRELERDNLIMRKDFEVFPKKVSYSLTPAGRELNAVLALICEWGAEDLLREAAQETQLL